MHQPTPEIHARSLIFRRRMKSSDARTTAEAPSLGGLMSNRCTGQAILARQDVLHGDVGVRQLGARMADRVPLVLHRDAGDVFLLHPVHVHVTVHLHREDPHQVRPQGPVQDRVPDVREDALRVRLAGGHLLLVHDQDHIGEARGHMPPARDRAEDAGPAAGEDPCVRLAITAAAVREVLALHVDAIEGVRRGPVYDHVDVRPGETRGVEGHLRRLEAHLLPGLLQPPAEERHPRTDHADLLHRPTPRTATAPVALGTNRQDCARPTRTPSIWCVPASPRSWRATSAARWRPVASKTLPQPSEPPDAFTGNRPSTAYSPLIALRPASPFLERPRASRCWSSLYENRSSTSANPISEAGRRTFARR